MQLRELGRTFETKRQVIRLRCRWLKIKASKLRNLAELKYLDLQIWYQTRRVRTLERKYLIADSKAFQNGIEEENNDR